MNAEGQAHRNECIALAAIGGLTRAGHLLPVDVRAQDVLRGIQNLASERNIARDELDIVKIQRDAALAELANREIEP